MARINIDDPIQVVIPQSTSGGDSEPGATQLKWACWRSGGLVSQLMTILRWSRHSPSCRLVSIPPRATCTQRLGSSLLHIDEARLYVLLNITSSSLLTRPPRCSLSSRYTLFYQRRQLQVRLC